MRKFRETNDLDIFREILSEIAIEAEDHFSGKVDQIISQKKEDEKRPNRKRKMSFPGLPERKGFFLLFNEKL